MWMTTSEIFSPTYDARVFHPLLWHDTFSSFHTLWMPFLQPRCFHHRHHQHHLRLYCPLSHVLPFATTHAPSPFVSIVQLFHWQQLGSQLHWKHIPPKLAHGYSWGGLLGRYYIVNSQVILKLKARKWINFIFLDRKKKYGNSIPLIVEIVCQCCAPQLFCDAMSR